MAGKSASLLTKTQRRRLHNDFEDVDEDAKRRDQQLIRERLRAGILDFQLLAAYPDRQLELAFENVSEEELRTALVDTYLTAERLRDLHRYDRDHLLADARTQAEEISGEARDVSSLARLDLRTEAEMRRQAEERLGTSRWETRATRAIKLASGAGLVSAILLFVYAFFHRPLNWASIGIMQTALFVGFFVGAVLLFVGGLVIIQLHALRYDFLPGVKTLARQSREIGRTARQQWEVEQERLGGDDPPAWENWRTIWTETSASPPANEEEAPLDRLRRRYAAGEFTDEQFERKLERLLDTETLEDAADRVKERE